MCLTTKNTSLSLKGVRESSRVGELEGKGKGERIDGVQLLKRQMEWNTEQNCRAQYYREGRSWFITREGGNHGAEYSFGGKIRRVDSFSWR